MNYIRQHPFVSAILINMILFGAAFAFCYPIFNSGDDVYLLYLLSGGFGQPPTELLHYHYGMHPYINLLLKNTFTHFPKFNWYTALLYLFHFITCTLVLFQWIKRNNLAFSIGAYLLFFTAIEIRFLLQPSFTNTALVTAMGGLLLLYDGLKLKNKTTITFVSGYALVLIAALLRLHLLAPAIIIAAPFIFAVLQRKHIKQIIFYSACLLALITFFIFLQQQYYKQHIPGWQEEESYRQTVIHHYNAPKKISANLPEDILIKVDFLKKGILWDKEFLSVEKVAAATKAVKITGTWQQDDFTERIYWLLMESRLGILVMVLLFLLKFPSFNRVEKTAAISSALLLFALCAGLLLFRKLPGYLVTGEMLVWLAFTGMTGSKQYDASTKRNWLFAAAGILLLAWSVIRTIKLNRWNTQQHTQFHCAYKLVAAQPQILFIVTDDKFPMDHFHVWDSPARYPLPNLLYKDHFLNNTFQHAYTRFGIPSPLAIVNNEKIIFTGTRAETIRRYYELKTQQTTHIINGPAGDTCFPTWRLIHSPLPDTSTR